MASISRKTFLQAAGAGALTLTAGALFDPRLPFANASTPHEHRGKNGVLRATLTLRDGSARVGGQLVGGLKLYNGLYPGPVLRARPGDRLLLTVNNQLTIPTNTHFHGLHVSPLPHQDYVLLSQTPGTTYGYDVRIPANHPGGLYWYHPHRHMYSDTSVYSGLAGLLLIEGGAADLPALAGVQRRLIALQSMVTKTVDGAVMIDPAGASASITTSLNGEVLPTYSMRPGETQFWQLGNVSNKVYYRLTIPGCAFTVVEEDGSMLWESYTTDEVVLPPGRRYGLVVTAPDSPATLEVLTKGFYAGPVSNYPAAKLATITVSGAPLESRTIPRILQERDDIRDDEIVKRRVVTLSESASLTAGPQFYINGVQYEDITPHDIFKPVRGTAEEWVIRNAPSTKQGRPREAHTFHIHINDFQVVGRGVWDPRTNTIISHAPVRAKGTLDTVNVRAQHYVVFRTRFTDFVGPTVFHCHLLYHEDHGMMGRFNIVAANGAGSDGALTGAHATHLH